MSSVEDISSTPVGSSRRSSISESSGARDIIVDSATVAENVPLPASPTPEVMDSGHDFTADNPSVSTEEERPEEEGDDSSAQLPSVDDAQSPSVGENQITLAIRPQASSSAEQIEQESNTPSREEDGDGDSVQSPPQPPSQPSSPRPTPGSTPAQTASSSAGRPNPITANFEPQSQRRRPSELALPRWQPDAEVTYCPICRTQFSFLVRKHHCRKCGRVVCNSCSPHRIVIPHQFIVRPPGESYFPLAPYFGEEGILDDLSSISGGERVRLCNPCVPDPNTTPPRTQHSASPLSPRSSHGRSQSGSSTHSSGLRPFMRPGFMAASGMDSYLDPHQRTRSVTVGSTSGSGSLLPERDLYQSPMHLGFETTYATSSGSRRHRSRAASRQGYGYPGTGHWLSSHALYNDSQHGAAPRESVNRPLPAPPMIAEEDECPVCHDELPSRNLPDFEKLRETHIEDCITNHSTYSGRRSVAGPSAEPHSTPPPRTERRTGMFPYTATEKDCVEDAECTICLEEYQVGVPMARLECLCRFHRACIASWFQAHPGRCPVHQHDSYGY